MIIETVKDIITLIKNLCSDFEVDVVAFSLTPENNSYVGCYWNKAVNISNKPEIEFAGEYDLGVALHELAHHIHYERNPQKKSAHTYTFFKICFEIRDWVESAYNINLKGTDIISNNFWNHKGFHKALNEWIERKNLS
jgi:hypothetical protein